VSTLAAHSPGTPPRSLTMQAGRSRAAPPVGRALRPQPPLRCRAARRRPHPPLAALPLPLTLIAADPTTAAWTVWAGLLGAGAAGLWAERTRLGRELSGCEAERGGEWGKARGRSRQPPP